MHTKKPTLCSEKKKKALEIFNVKTLINLLKKDGYFSIYVKQLEQIADLLCLDRAGERGINNK